MDAVLTLIVIASLRLIHYGAIGGFLSYLVSEFFGASHTVSVLIALLVGLLTPIVFGAITVLLL